MTNSYYVKAATIARNTNARAEPVNQELQSIQEGFEKLPDPEQLNGASTSHATDTGAANAYVVSITGGPTNPTAGTHAAFFAVNANTGASTLSYATWDPKAIKRGNGDALVAGDITAGQLVELRYSGSYWALTGATNQQLVAADVSAAAAASSATAAAGSATAAASSASAAATSEGNAATSATGAAGSATSAATSATVATTAQTAAETAQTAAETAAAVVATGLDLPGLGATTESADDDLIGIYDVSQAGHRKITKANFVAGIGGGGTHDFVASGAISSGKFAALNSDGSVSIVAETVTAANAGTPVEFEAADVANSCAAFNPAEGVVVVAYADNGNSGHLTAIAGTVNGGSILFGSPVVLHAAAVAHIEITNCKSSESKLFVSYQNTSNLSYGTGVVLSVSGTVITPGPPVVFESATTSNTACCYDQFTDRVFVAYTYGGAVGSSKYVAASIGGTVPAFGTPAVFNATNGTVHGCYFDEYVNNVITCYEDDQQDGYLIAATIGGTVATFGTGVAFYTLNPRAVSVCSAGPGKAAALYQIGDSPSSGAYCKIATIVDKAITFGAQVSINTDDCGYQLRGVYDSFTGSVLAIFRNTDDSTSVLHVGVIAGDSIAFGGENSFTADNPFGDDIGATFDTTANRAVITYSKFSADFGQAVVWQTGFTSTNADAWIGAASASVLDAATGTFTVPGGVNDQQTGLTIGQNYYLQDDGTLATSGTRHVGKATKTTELFINPLDLAVAAEMSEMGTLADAATITPDFRVSINHKVTLAGNRTLANPVNAKAGQSGLVRVVQDTTGSRTLAYGSAWKFAGGAPTLSTDAGAVDAIAYFVVSTAPLEIMASFSAGYA